MKFIRQLLFVCCLIGSYNNLIRAQVFIDNLIVQLQVIGKNSIGEPVINLGKRDAYYDDRDGFDDYVIELYLPYQDQVYLQFSLMPQSSKVDIGNVKIQIVQELDRDKKPHIVELPNNRYLLDNTTLSEPEDVLEFRFFQRERFFQGKIYLTWRGFKKTEELGNKSGDIIINLEDTTLEVKPGYSIEIGTYDFLPKEGHFNDLKPFLTPSAALYLRKKLPFEYRLHLGAFPSHIAEQKKMQIAKMPHYSGAHLVPEAGGISTPYSYEKNILVNPSFRVQNINNAIHHNDPFKDEPQQEMLAVITTSKEGVPINDYHVTMKERSPSSYPRPVSGDRPRGESKAFPNHYKTHLYTYSTYSSTAMSPENYEYPSTRIPINFTPTPGFSIQIIALEQMPSFRQFHIPPGQPVYGKQEDKFYKILIGPFATRPLAEAVLNDVKKAGYPTAWIVPEGGYAPQYWKMSEGRWPASPPSAYQQIEQRTHLVKKGETLLYIARQYNLDLGHLIQINQLENKNMILPGQLLKLE